MAFFPVQAKAFHEGVFAHVRIGNAFMAEKAEGGEVVLQEESCCHLSDLYGVLHDPYERRHLHLFEEIYDGLFCGGKCVDDLFVQGADYESIKLREIRRAYGGFKVKHRQRPIFAFLGVVDYAGAKIAAESPFALD